MPPDSPTPTPTETSLSDLVEALLRDPRGQFCPRSVVLCVLQASGAEQVVMQVGEDALGRVQVLTTEPLSDGVEYGLCDWLWDNAAQPDRPTQVYVLDSTREGQRPEDAGVRCWVNTLIPLRMTAPQDGVQEGAKEGDLP